jgi:hypothetical protein
MCGKERTCRSRFLEVWQGKELAMHFADLWQIKDLGAVASDEWREKAREERMAGGARTLEDPGEERGMQEPHLQVGRLRRGRSRNTLSREEVGKRKIVGTLKREILRLAKLARSG